MGQRRVLVVDDEPTIAASVAARLRAEGFAVDVAHDGPSAVAAVAEAEPDLVVLDVMLPGFDGLEVCRRIQARRPVPVLMLTARDAETDVLVGLGVGADDYMTKPFSIRELAARVHALLRRVERAASRRPATAADRARRAGDRPGAAPGDPRRRAGAPHPDRVRPAAAPGRAAAHGAGPGGAAGAGVGLVATSTGTRTVDSHVKALRRKLGRRPDPHRARRRVRAGGAAMTALDRVAAVVDLLPRPLDPVRSVKLKISILLLASGGVGLAYLWLRSTGGSRRSRSRWSRWRIVLLTAQVLGHGMTRPLRAMTAAARAMAQGDYSRRVRATSRDEVGAARRSRSTRWPPTWPPPTSSAVS